MKMKQDFWMMLGFMAVLLFVGISLLINTSKSCDVYIAYNATVDSINSNLNLTNSPNLAEIKVACYKMCIDQLHGDSSLLMTCLNKCENLK